MLTVYGILTVVTEIVVLATCLLALFLAAGLF